MTKPPSLQTADAIARGRRLDVYFGVVAPTGIRRKTFEALLKSTLDRFGYKMKLWRISDLLEDYKGITVDRTDDTAYLRTAMDAGTKLRDEVSKDCLARSVMLSIRKYREEHEQGELPPHVHVIWSLKHPEEVATLRLVYGANFHLVALFASKEERLLELMQGRPGLDKQLALKAIERDEDESGRSHGQKTRRTFQLADVFLPWGSKPNTKELSRFLDLVFGKPTATPTLDEHRMFLAFASATRSGDLSRQVGAVLTNPLGDVLAIGSNDVPRRGGGSYWPTPDDQRDHIKGADANTVTRTKLMEEAAVELCDEAGNRGDERRKEIAEKLSRTPLRGITEYGRAVHAEMDALVACARSARSPVGTTMYVTTYPCHSCARHIIAAGVSRVVFIEPYPKSRSLELHVDDLVEVPPRVAVPEPGSKVHLEPFVGVGPRRFIDYFSMNLGSGYLITRKNDSDGSVIEWNAKEAAPRLQSSEAGLIATETRLASEILTYLKDPD